MGTAGDTDGSDKVTVCSFNRSLFGIEYMTLNGSLPIAFTAFNNKRCIEFGCSRGFLLDLVTLQICLPESQIRVLDAFCLVGNSNNIKHNSDKQHQHKKQEQFLVMAFDKIQNMTP